jgi:hypothetical protein
MSRQTTIQTQTTAKPNFTPIASNVLQRQCACGQHTSAGGECEKCKQKREGTLQRAAIDSAPAHAAPPIVHDVLRSPGQPLGAGAHAFIEPRFGHDFSQVHVYANTKATESALLGSTLSSPLKPSVEKAAPEVSNPNQVSRTKPPSAGRSTVVEHNKQRISATIRRADKPRPSESGGYFTSGERSAINPRFASRYNDARPGSEETSVIDLASLLAQTGMTTPAESISEPQEGETVRLPDIVLDPTIRETDAIAGTLTYSPTITQSGAAPAPFGATSPYTFTMSGITVTSAAAIFTVTATIDNPITFQVTGGGNTDISSDTDPDITQTNYPTVVSDLTPDMSDLNGRPPRTQFWAEDLCIRHERFHATDGIGHARSGVTLAQNWLNIQTAASVADVNTLIGQIPARVIATRSAAMTHPGRENRAYGDGAPSYLARATAIKTKGDAGGYGTPGAAPTGMSRGAKTAIGIGGGAVVGAGIGALAGGPVGALVGAGLGALVGGIGSLFF